MRLARRLLILTTFLLLSASTGYAQQQTNSTTTLDVQTLEIAERAVAEVKASREHIANLEALDAAKTEQIALLKEMYRLSQVQATDLRDSLSHERAVNVAHTQKEDKLEARIEKLEKRGGSKIGTVLKIVAGIGLGILLHN